MSEASNKNKQEGKEWATPQVVDLSALAQLVASYIIRPEQHRWLRYTVTTKSEVRSALQTLMATPNAAATDLKHARAEFAQIERSNSRFRDVVGLTCATAFGVVVATVAMNVLGLGALPSMLIGGTVAAITAGIQARISFQRDKQHRAAEEKGFVLRMLLYRARHRLLREDEAMALVEALGTTGDRSLDTKIRVRLVRDLPLTWKTEAEAPQPQEAAQLF